MAPCLLQAGERSVQPGIDRPNRDAERVRHLAVFQPLVVRQDHDLSQEFRQRVNARADHTPRLLALGVAERLRTPGFEQFQEAPNLAVRPGPGLPVEADRRVPAGPPQGVDRLVRGDRVEPGADRAAGLALVPLQVELEERVLAHGVGQVGVAEVAA